MTRPTLRLELSVVVCLECSAGGGGRGRAAVHEPSVVATGANHRILVTKLPASRMTPVAHFVPNADASRLIPMDGAVFAGGTDELH